MKQLDKISQTLIINGTLTEQPGLLYGKTGIAVFFFHYAKITGNSLFQEYALDLIEEVQKQITVTTPLRYDIGISGIGVGFDYFLQNGFIEADDDIFEDFDERMYRAAMSEKYPDLSLQGGLAGLGRYFLYRLRSSGNKDRILQEALTKIAQEISLKIEANKASENDQPDVYRFMRDLVTLPEYAEKYASSLQLCKEWDCIWKPDIQTLLPNTNLLPRLYLIQHYFNMDLAEEIGREWKKWEEDDIYTISNMGLLNGWTAEGMLYLTCFHNLDKSWLNLL